MILAALLTTVVMCWEPPRGLGRYAAPFQPTCCVWTGPILWKGIVGYVDGVPIYRHAWASYFAIPEEPGCPLPRTEETDVLLEPVANWNPNTSAQVGLQLSGDRMVASGLPGTKATFAFTGTKAIWDGFPCEICGIADVLIDDVKVASVDTYQPRPRPTGSLVLYETPVLPNGPHTLSIVVTGEKNPLSGNPYIVVDAFELAAAEMPLCTSLLPAPSVGEVIGYVIPEFLAVAGSGELDRVQGHAAPSLDHAGGGAATP